LTELATTNNNYSNTDVCVFKGRNPTPTITHFLTLRLWPFTLCNQSHTVIISQDHCVNQN